MAGLGALTAPRARAQKTIKTVRLPIGQTKVFKGAGACLSGGYAIEAAAATELSTIGVFSETVDNSAGASGAKTAEVEFPQELHGEYFANGTSGDAVAITDIGALCYWIDDQTVSISDGSGTRSPAGFVGGVDAQLGVLVAIQPIMNQAIATPTITSFANAAHGHTDAAGGGVLAAPAITSFAAAAHTHGNAAGGGALRMIDGGTLAWTGVTCTISTPGTWKHYRAPAAATQASVISLGNTSAVMGDMVKITSAGACTQTITYFDGTYARTAALSASKTHTVIASYDGAVWTFDYTVGAN
jgi:hypothetical protein